MRQTANHTGGRLPGGARVGRLGAGRGAVSEGAVQGREGGEGRGLGEGEM